MSKLMRAIPEILIIIKGIKAAVKAVSWVAFLLLLVSFTWAIMLTNEYHQGHLSDDELEDGSIETLFGNMGKSMLHLVVMGTILDDVTYCCDIIRASGDYHILLLFIIYILINSFTLLNMLVGILVEVVGATAEGEEKRIMEERAGESIRTIFTQMDKDSSGKISKDEFLGVRLDDDEQDDDPDSPRGPPNRQTSPAQSDATTPGKRRELVRSALEELDIKGGDFDKYMELLFHGDEKEVSFETLLNMILRLRPGTEMSSLDFNAFRKRINKYYEELSESCEKVEGICDQYEGICIVRSVIEEEHLLNQVQHVQPGAFLTPPGTLVDSGASCAWADGPHIGSTAPIGAPPKNRITKTMLSRLEVASSISIVKELQRRHDIADLEATGVPLSMMTEELRQRIEAMTDLS